MVMGKGRGGERRSPMCFQSNSASARPPLPAARACTFFFLQVDNSCSTNALRGLLTGGDRGRSVFFKL